LLRVVCVAGLIGRDHDGSRAGDGQDAMFVRSANRSFRRVMLKVTGLPEAPP